MPRMAHSEDQIVAVLHSGAGEKVITDEDLRNIAEGFQYLREHADGKTGVYHQFNQRTCARQAPYPNRHFTAPSGAGRNASSFRWAMLKKFCTQTPPFSPLQSASDWVRRRIQDHSRAPVTELPRVAGGFQSWISLVWR